MDHHESQAELNPSPSSPAAYSPAASSPAPSSPAEWAHELRRRPLEIPVWNQLPQFQPGRPVAILDLDETLYVGEGSPPRFTVRPGARALIKGLTELDFQLMVWTAATHEWAEAGLLDLWISGIDLPLVGAFDRQRCSRRYDFDVAELTHYKRLQKLRSALRRAQLSRDDVLVIDDHPTAWASSFGNQARVPAFTGDMHDPALNALLADVQHWHARWQAGQPLRRIHKGRWSPRC